MNPETKIQKDRDSMAYPLFSVLFKGEPAPTRDAQIYARFKIFHRENPHVFEHFCRFAFQVIKAGKKRYSADAILHQIRWHVDIETRGDLVKVNNDFARCFGDLFCATYPVHSDLFERRKRTSENRTAYTTDMSVVPAEPAEPNAAQEYDLTELATQNTREFHRP
jgi:hypothetical protein